MKPYRNLKIQSLAIATLFVVTSLIGIQFLPALPVILVLASLAVTGLSWRLFRALHQQIGEQEFNNFRQQEALSGLYATLDIQHPLPRTRHTAASPDFLHFLANEIFRLRPRLIVEVGSGTSTLIAAYCLKKIGGGKIISLDHLEKYADITRDTLVSHQLQNFAEVRFAPIKAYDIEGTKHPWYDDAKLTDCESIDLLIVDGPPKMLAEKARYPAIPLLKDKLNPATIVLLDDGDRKAERQIVELWRSEFSLEYHRIPTEKGAYSCYFRQPSE
ncbi:MAG: class I SAM-dependent methyltransferase [Pseudomonadota bacterium]